MIFLYTIKFVLFKSHNFSLEHFYIFITHINELKLL